MHRVQGKKILACADTELIGKTVQHNEISFHVRESFYKEEHVTATEMKKLLDEADSANLVGKKAVQVALDNGWIKKEDIIQIDKVPHAQIFKI